MQPVIEYAFLEHYYISPKERYENILCDLINHSSAFTKIGGGSFEQIKIQNSSQPDVIVPTSGYSLDFKLMISESLAEFRNLSRPRIVEMVPGVKIHQPGKKIKQKAVIFPNAFRDITEEQLQGYRQEKDVASKSIVRFFDKNLNISKNILVFLPLYISSVDQTLSPDLQFELIRKDFSDTLQYIHSYRSTNQPSFDTYLVYIVNIPRIRNYSFVLTQFTDSGLCVLDTVDMFSLKTVQHLFDEFSL